MGPVSSGTEVTMRMVIIHKRSCSKEETVGRVKDVLIKELTNDNKEDDDKEYDDVHQLITEQRRRIKS